jgi:glucokinase
VPPVAAPAVGVDVGGTKLLALRLDPDGTITADPIRISPRNGDELVVEVLATASRLMGDEPAALGIGVPGLVDPAGVVQLAPNLQGLNGLALTAALRAELPNTALWVGNDATGACWGEHERGAALGCDDVVMVALGTGIGGGIISRGELLEGSNCYAGEFGHMVVDPHGPRCPCGKRGCWERFASGSGLASLGREAAVAGEAPRLVELAGGDPEGVRGEHVTRAAAEGDDPALEVMQQFAWWLALGLANLANALDPRLIVLGGGLIESADVLLEPTRRAFADLVAAPSARVGLEIVPAALGSRAGAIGAGLRALRARPANDNEAPEPVQ